MRRSPDGMLATAIAALHVKTVECWNPKLVSIAIKPKSAEANFLSLLMWRKEDATEDLAANSKHNHKLINLMQQEILNPNF